MIEGNKTILDLMGFVTLRFQLAGHTFLHEFHVLRVHPVDIIIGGELARPHECGLTIRRPGAISLSWASLPAADARVIANSGEVHMTRSCISMSFDSLL